MRCILPIHVQATAEALPVAVILRSGKTPSGVEVRCRLRRLFQRVRRQWPTTRITLTCPRPRAHRPGERHALRLP